MCVAFLGPLPNGESPGPAAQAHDPAVGHHQSLQWARVDPDLVNPSKNDSSNLAGMSPYISLKIKKRHYEHHMIEAHK